MNRDAGLRTDFGGSNQQRKGKNGGSSDQLPKRSYADLKGIMGFSNRYTFSDVSNLLVRHL